MESIFPEIGSVLAKARKEKGISPQEVAKSIKVHHKYITAIEEGRFIDIPGPIYRIGYLKLYSEFLKQETKELVDKYKQASHLLRHTESVMMHGDPNIEELNPSPKIILISLLLMLITYSVWFQFSYYSEPPIDFSKHNKALETLIIEAAEKIKQEN